MENKLQAIFLMLQKGDVVSITITKPSLVTETHIEFSFRGNHYSFTSKDAVWIHLEHSKYRVLMTSDAAAARKITYMRHTRVSKS